MANITENTAEWADIYLIEMADLVLGGDGDGDIDNKQAHGLMKRTNYLKQELEKQGVDIVLGMIGNSYTTDDLIIVRGCIVDDDIGGTSTITAGAILYNGIIYQVSAASIPSPSNTLVYKINSTGNPHTIELVNDESGEGIADFDSATVKYLMSRKIVPIGNWNMTTETVFVNHGLTGGLHLKIKGYSAVVYNDGGNNVYKLDLWENAPESVEGGVGGATSTTIPLHRRTGGVFDNFNFSSGSINRGFLTIWYGDI